MRLPGSPPPASSAAIDEAIKMGDPAAAENAHGTATEVEVLSRDSAMESLYKGFQNIVDCPTMGEDELAKCILNLDALIQKISGDESVLEGAQRLMCEFLIGDEARFFEVARKLKGFDFEQGEQPALLTWIKEVLVEQVVLTVNPPVLFAREDVHEFVQECRKWNLGIKFDLDIFTDDIPALFEDVCENLERGVYSDDGAGRDVPFSSEHYAAFLFTLDAVFQELPHRYPELKVRLKGMIESFLKDHSERVAEIRTALSESSVDYKQDTIRILNNFQIMILVDDFSAQREEASRKQPSNPFTGLFGASTGKVPYVTLPNGLENLVPFKDYQKGIERHLPDTILPVHNASSEE